MKLIKYISVVVLISVSLLSLLVGLYRQGQNNFLKVKNPVKEMLYGNENYDILFIGSSRTRMHVNTRVIDSITKWNTYNAGCNGANIIETNLMLQCYLQRQIHPKIV